MMKKSGILLVLVLLLFSACEKKETVSDIAPEAVAESTAEILGGPTRFATADEDFFETNFGEQDAEKAIRFSTDGNGVCEFGIFRVTQENETEELRHAVQNYLQTEEEALASLSGLYPDEVLSENIQRYRNATVKIKGRYVYYLVMSDSERSSAENAICNAIGK